MNDESLKLTAYLGERERADGRFAADALTDIYARHQLQASLVLRGVEGFGPKHQLRTDRLLSLSEDLPMVSVAVDRRERIEPALAEVERLRFSGLVTVERARMPAGRLDQLGLERDLHDEAKLTVYLGRQQRAAGRPAYEAVVALLHRHGVAGATVLLGVDGTAHGVRQRARFFGRNADVPLMVIAVGRGACIAAALPELDALLPHPLVTVERVRVCKRDGQPLAEPETLAPADPESLGVWQKMMVYASEQARHDGQPLHHALVRELRRAGASGATSLRGIWGYHGDHAPHGDSFWQLRRRVPVVTVVVDTPQRIARWYAIADALTDRTGLVTAEAVPAHRATSPGAERGGLRLAALPDPG